ncbi:MAG: sulfur-oxidizing protein SoxY [Granulosicoccus sp.]|jgi:sulfur-oxidizing protein SoxY
MNFERELSSMNISRRTWLSTSAAAAAAAFFGVPGSAIASIEDVEKLIGEYGAGATAEAGGPLQLTTPEIAENGNSVPVSVMVESPMSEDDYIESVMVMAGNNPNPEVVTFHFSPASGIAKASTRMRLAKTQDVFAVAKTNTGKLYKVSNNVKVTIGGCGG